MAKDGVSQLELARRLGITQPAVSELLSQKRGIVPRSLLRALDALNLRLEVVPKGADNA